MEHEILSDISKKNIHWSFLKTLCNIYKQNKDIYKSIEYIYNDVLNTFPNRDILNSL